MHHRTTNALSMAARIIAVILLVTVSLIVTGIADAMNSPEPLSISQWGAVVGIVLVCHTLISVTHDHLKARSRSEPKP
ncbi:MAG: hypothetical protein AWU57_478 [Marinobacter sp. T13-3]|nr:MAG: hypothetical protein AWU57_478 [Marinobacter sp. T13-3]